MRKKRKTLQAGWDLLCGSSLAASHSKGGTTAKSSHFEEEVQSWPLRACSAFSVPAWLRSQMPFAYFLFFLDELSSVSATLHVGYSCCIYTKIPSAILRRRDFSFS